LASDCKWLFSFMPFASVEIVGSVSGKMNANRSRESNGYISNLGMLVLLCGLEEGMPGLLISKPVILLCFLTTLVSSNTFQHSLFPPKSLSLQLRYPRNTEKYVRSLRREHSSN
jgi:hypothetical protein